MRRRRHVSSTPNKQKELVSARNGEFVPKDEIATAIACCAGCLAGGVATGESIDLLRPLSISYDASTGRGDRPLYFL